MWLRGLCNRNVAVVLVTTAIILLSGCQLVKTKANDKAMDDAPPALTSTAVTDFSDCVRQYGEVHVTNGTDDEVFLKDAGKAVSQDDYFTLKNQLGMKFIDDGWFYFENIITDDQNCYLAVGIMGAAGCFGNNKNNAPIVVKYDSNLNILGYYLLDIYSDKVDGINGSVYAGFTGIVQDENGDYVAVGYLDNMGRMENLSGVIAKFDRELNLIATSVTGEGFAYVSITTSLDGGYYVAGGDARNGYPSNADNFDTEGTFGLVAKYDGFLELEKINTQMSSGCASLEDIIVDKNGGIVVVGCARGEAMESIQPFGGVNKRCVGYIAKLDTELNVIVSEIFFEPDDIQPHSECIFKSVVEESAGTFVINGSQRFFVSAKGNSSNYDGVVASSILVRYSSDLKILHKKSFDNNPNSNAEGGSTLLNGMVETEMFFVCAGSTSVPNGFFMQGADENFSGFIVSLDKEFNYLGRVNFGNGGFFDSITEGISGNIVALGSVEIDNVSLDAEVESTSVMDIVEFIPNR